MPEPDMPEPERACRDDFGANHSQENPYRLEPGRSPWSGRICAEEDWFIFSAEAGERLYLRIRFAHARGDLDLELFAPSGERLERLESADNNELLEGILPDTGEYLVRLFPFSPENFDQRYDIELEFGEQPSCGEAIACGPMLSCVDARCRPNRCVLDTDCPSEFVCGAGEAAGRCSQCFEDSDCPLSTRCEAERCEPIDLCEDGYEPNNIPEESIPLPALEPLRAFACGDEDWYRLTLEEGQDLFVTLSFDPAAVNLDLELMNAEGASLAISASPAQGQEEVGLRMAAGADYMLRIFSPEAPERPAAYELVFRDAE